MLKQNKRPSTTTRRGFGKDILSHTFWTLLWTNQSNDESDNQPSALSIANGIAVQCNSHWKRRFPYNHPIFLLQSKWSLFSQFHCIYCFCSYYPQGRFTTQTRRRTPFWISMDWSGQLYLALFFVSFPICAMKTAIPLRLHTYVWSVIVQLITLFTSSLPSCYCMPVWVCIWMPSLCSCFLSSEQLKQLEDRQFPYLFIQTLLDVDVIQGRRVFTG